MGLVKIIVGFLLAMLILNGLRTHDSALWQCSSAIVRELTQSIPTERR